MIEVELKAKMRSLEETEKGLVSLGFSRQDIVIEEDIYFNGNNHDFSKTDEALRLRTASDVNSEKEICMLTYKGPKLDDESQSRVEYETAVSDHKAVQKTLQALGYNTVFKIIKKRMLYKLDSITACLDDVEGLGQFLELEKMVENDSLREPAIRQLKDIFDKLEIPKEDTSLLSYLELLIKK